MCLGSEGQCGLCPLSPTRAPPDQPLRAPLCLLADVSVPLTSVAAGHLLSLASYWCPASDTSLTVQGCESSAACMANLPAWPLGPKRDEATPSPDFNLGRRPGLRQLDARELCILGPVALGGAASCLKSPLEEAALGAWLVQGESRGGCSLHLPFARVSCGSSVIRVRASC